MTERSPQEQEKYIVRFPEGMRDALKAEAEKNNRSLNAEIVARLKSTLETINNQYNSTSESILERLLDDNLKLRTKIDALVMEVKEFKNKENKLLVDELLNERKRTEEMLSRYVDMDSNSYGNISDFAEAEKAGSPTRSRQLTREEARSLGIDRDDVIIVSRSPADIGTVTNSPEASLEVDGETKPLTPKPKKK